MPWKGLRIGLPDTSDSKRHSVLDRSRHSEQLPRPSLSASNLVPRHSESAPRSPRLTGPDGDDEDDDDDANGENGASRLAVPGEHTDNNIPSPGAGDPPTSGETLGGSLRRNRFSFMRLRHASDPQLSKSYAKAEQKPPPVPAIPPRKSFSMWTPARPAIPYLS